MGEVKKIDFIDELFESQKKILPFLIPLVYAIGYVYSVSYYKSFGINIKYYTDIYDWIYNGVEILLTVLLFYLIFRFFINEKSLVSIMNGFGFDGNKWGWLLFFIIVIVLNIIVTSIAVNLNLYYNQNFWFIFIMQTTIAFLTIQPDTFYSKEHMASIFFLVSIIILVMSFLLGKIESHRVSEKITNYRVEFLYHDSIISTDTDSLSFVGETTEFIFLYNINSEKAELFKKDDISNLRFFPSIWDMEEFSETSKSSRPNDQGIIHQ